MVIKNDEYDKIWTEVDVKKERGMKTKKIVEILQCLEKVECIKNITKVQYKVGMDEE